MQPTLNTRLSLAVFVISFGACRDSSNDQGPCEELLVCCRALSAEAQTECQNAYDQYHNEPDADSLCQTALDSIHGIGQCSGTTKAGMDLTIRSYNDWKRRAAVTCRNRSQSILPVDQALFKLELRDGTVRQGDPSYYEGDCHVEIAPGATTSCNVRFYDPELRVEPGVRIYYVYPSHEVTVPVPQDSQCVLGPENTLSACTDGCNNDDDNSTWIDCDDRDCCDVLRANSVTCAAGVYCGP